jgi:hypothetical protein
MLLVIGLFFGSGGEFFAEVDGGDGRTEMDGVISVRLQKMLGSMPPTEPVAVWVFFRDKGITDQAGLNRALQQRKSRFSSRVLWRRSKTMGKQTVLQGDLPVFAGYVSEVLSAGCALRHKTSWLNAISVDATSDMIEKISKLPFVTRIQRVAKLGRIDPIDVRKTGKPGGTSLVLQTQHSLDYGASYDQLLQMNVPAAHDSGYSGAGVIIMMLDTGYYKDHESLAGQNIIAEWDFVFGDGETQNEPEDRPDQHSHGTATWSALGGYYPGELIGPAYNASFLLAKTEDLRSETPAEEDNYVAALEWADTLGVDITSASLCYRVFDDSLDTYTYEDLDGNTAVISVAVDEAARRGILVCNAISNNGEEGLGSLWTPADADSMISCGAVDQDGQIAYFSSRGPAYDGRIKPEVVARGYYTYAASDNGDYGWMAGTSLSTPLVAGSAALVLEAHPEWGPMEVREALMSTADRASSPNIAYGSGIIDVLSAIYENGLELTPSAFSLSTPEPGDSVHNVDIDFNWSASADPIGGDILYKLLVSTDSSFVDPMVTWDIEENSYTLTGTLEEGTYYWKVFAYTLQGIYRASSEIVQFTAAKLTGTGDDGPVVLLPRSFDLKQNYPNPFNPHTTISFDIPNHGEKGKNETTTAQLNIYDIRGRLVRALYRGELESGRYQFSWDGRDESGRSVPSGIYIYRLVAGDWSSVKKMVLSK